MFVLIDKLIHYTFAYVMLLLPIQRQGCQDIDDAMHAKGKVL